MPNDDLADIINSARQFRETVLNLHIFEKEYRDKVGLSESTSASELDADLPLHPVIIRDELTSYKESFTKLQTQFVGKEAQEKFYRLLLQDPSFNVTFEELQELEEAVQALETSTTSEIPTLDERITSKCSQLEKDYLTILEELDDVMPLLDELRHDERELERIENSISNESSLTIDEANAILAKQVDELVEVNMMIDERRDKINEISRQIATLEQEVDELEKERKVAEAEYAEVAARGEHRDEQVEQAALWYAAVTESTNKMFGIDEVTFESPSTIKVRYATSEKHVLHIQFDPVSGEFVNAAVAGDACNIEDLVNIAKRRGSKEATSLVVHGALAKLKTLQNR